MVVKIMLAICLLLSISLSVFSSIGNAEIREQIRKDKTHISIKQAKEIALKKINGKVLTVEREKENGKPIYEVKILTNDKVLFEVEVDAQTGKIVEVEKEGKVKDEKRKNN